MDYTAINFQDCPDRIVEYAQNHRKLFSGLPTETQHQVAYHSA